MEYLVYLTYPVLAGILLWGAKLVKRGEWNEEFLSLSQVKYLQGGGAICIMLHHIGQETCASWQSYELYPGLELFVPFGYYFVGIFMFCSGYGLYKSYHAKPNYLEGFFAKRILPLIVAFYSTGLIFFVARICMGEPMSPWKIFCYLTGLGMPNPNTWYVIVMPLLYYFFYLAFRSSGAGETSVEGEDRRRVRRVFLYCLLYVVAGTFINHNDYWMRGEWWYNSVHFFPLGIWFASREKALLEKIKRRYVVYLVLSFIGMFVLYGVSEAACGIFSYYAEYWGIPQIFVALRRMACLVFQMFASGAFVAFVFLLLMKLKLGNRFLGFMGSITLEFYLIHGLFLELFAYRFCDVVPSITRITNVALLILVVFLPSVPAAMGLQKLHRKIQKWVQQRGAGNMTGWS